MLKNKESRHVKAASQSNKQLHNTTESADKQDNETASIKTAGEKKAMQPNTRFKARAQDNIRRGYYSFNEDFNTFVAFEIGKTLGRLGYDENAKLTLAALMVSVNLDRVASALECLAKE